jgi:hypothetical protein
MNQNRLDTIVVNRKIIVIDVSIDIVAIRDNNSPIKLIELGKLRLANINNNNIYRIIKSNINNESIYLV